MTAVLSYYKKNRAVKWLTFLLILVSIVIVSGRVFSLDGMERKIHYNNDTWNVQDDFKKEWYFHGETVSFEVDLSDDYQEGFNEESPPFSLSGIFQGVEVNPSDIQMEPIYIEVEQEDGEGPGESDGTEEADSTEEEGPYDEENGNEHELGENTEENKEEQQAEEEIEEPAEPIMEFTGRYTVEVTVPAIQGNHQDGVLALVFTVNGDNHWGIPSMTKDFHMERDTTPPEIRLVSPEGLEGNRYENEITVEVEVEDENLAPELVTFEVKKDGENHSKSWERTEQGNIYSYTTYFESDGDFEIFVNASDKAGNVAEELELPFTINIHGVESSVTNADGTIVNGGFSRHKDIELRITNGVRIYDVVVEVEKDGEILKDLIIEESWFLGRRSVHLNIELPEEGSYELHATVLERRGGPFSPGRDIELSPFSFTVDTTQPEIHVGGIVDGTITDTLPELAVTVSDIHLDKETPATITVKKDGNEYLLTDDFTITEAEGSSIQYLYSFNDSSIPHEDGMYELFVTSVDLAGNVSTTAPHPITFTIDRESPEITISGVEDNGYHNTPEVEVIVEDFTLDPETTYLLVEVMGDDGWVEYEEDLTWRQSGNTTLIMDHTFKVDDIYRITVHASDQAGNTANDSVIFTNDTKDPILTIDGVTSGEEYKDPFVGDRKITVRVEDKNIDLDQTLLTVTKTDIQGSTVEVEVDELPFLSDIVAENTYSFTEDGIYVMDFRSTDKAGNMTVHESITFTIDTTLPHISIDGVDTGGNPHYRSTREVEITVEDLTLDVGETFIDFKLDGEKYAGKFNKEMLSDFKVLYTYDFSEEGTYELTIASEDRVKNDKVKTSVSFVIDKTAPVIELSGVKDNSFIQRGNVDIQVTERYFDTNTVDVIVKKDGKLYTHESLPVWENHGETSRLRLTFDETHEDGDYEVTVTAIDKAGNEAESKNVHFTLDNTKPEITISEPDRYSNQKETVTVQVMEENYENNRVNVEIVKKDPVSKEVISRTQGEWENTGKETTAHYSFEQEYEYTVNVTATDAAGNTATPKSVTFSIDKQAPELAISGIENGEHYPSARAVFSVQDTTIDLSTTTVMVTKNGDSYNSIGSFRMEPGSKTTGTLNHTFQEEGNYVVQFESTDKAGNKALHEKLEFVIDSTSPVVKIEGVEDNSFNPEDKSVTISVEELNYRTNIVDIEVTRDNQPYQMGEWRNTGVLSQLRHTFSQDGLYTITVTAADKAGNGPVTKTMTFTIDKTNPVIDINGVENEAYYNMNRPVEVTITDRNLDVNIISVTRNGFSYPAGNFSVNGNTASLQYTFNQEGRYVMEVVAIDKAGNRSTDTITFTIDKTPPEITPFMGDSGRIIENGVYINQMFTPHFALSEPEDMIVSVVLNGSDVTGRIPVASTDMEYHYVVQAVDRAGNETTLEVRFILDLTNPTLEISGVVEGFFNHAITPEVTYYDTNLDPSRTFVTLNDEPFVNGTLLEEEMDYILQAVVTDFADNVTSRTIVFTIDKTAPMIRFMEPLSGRYFNSHVLPEFIIDSLSPYEIITITLNGQPYTIGEAIEEEGLHVLYFELLDSAGNITQLTVEFIIDITPPEVVYEGVEMDGIYYDPVDLTIRLGNPQDKFHSITINGELFSGDLKVEEGMEVLQTTLSEIRAYEIIVEAYDEAGNETVFILPFEIAEKSVFAKYYENKLLFAGSIVGFIGIVTTGISIFAVRRKKKHHRDEEIELEE